MPVRGRFHRAGPPCSASACSTNPNRKMLPARIHARRALLLDLKHRGFTFPEMAERLGRTNSALSQAVDPRGAEWGKGRTSRARHHTHEDHHPWQRNCSNRRMFADTIRRIQRRVRRSRTTRSRHERHASSTRRPTARPREADADVRDLPRQGACRRRPGDRGEDAEHEAPPTALFLTPGNNLSRSDPRQMEISALRRSSSAASAEDKEYTVANGEDSRSTASADPLARAGAQGDEAWWRPTPFQAIPVRPSRRSNFRHRPLRRGGDHGQRALGIGHHPGRPGRGRGQPGDAP